MIAGFTAGERDYLRRELDVFFSTVPSVAEGFLLKTSLARRPRCRQAEAVADGASGVGTKADVCGRQPRRPVLADFSPTAFGLQAR
jgi:hypothetical protein